MERMRELFDAYEGVVRELRVELAVVRAERDEARRGLAEVGSKVLDAILPAVDALARQAPPVAAVCPPPPASLANEALTKHCVVCGNEFTVRSARQRMCPDCKPQPDLHPSAPVTPPRAPDLMDAILATLRDCPPRRRTVEAEWEITGKDMSKEGRVLAEREPGRLGDGTLCEEADGVPSHVVRATDVSRAKRVAEAGSVATTLHCAQGAGGCGLPYEYRHHDGEHVKAALLCLPCRGRADRRREDENVLLARRGREEAGARAGVDPDPAAPTRVPGPAVRPRTGARSPVFADKVCNYPGCRLVFSPTSGRSKYCPAHTTAPAVAARAVPGHASAPVAPVVLHSAPERPAPPPPPVPAALAVAARVALPPRDEAEYETTWDGAAWRPEQKGVDDA